MAGRPKTRQKMEEAAKAAGMTYEEYREKMLAAKRQEEEKKAADKEQKEAAKELREAVKLKRNELSEFMVRFVASNMKKYGQAILDQLVADDPREASRFLSNLMKFAAPTVADPDKLDAGKKGKDEKKVNPEYKDALDHINKMKKQFEKPDKQ